MRKQYFIEDLNEYINSPKCSGAFYINGKWGSGKTFFIKKYFDDENINRDKFSNFYTYVSLFGIKNISILERMVFGHTPIKECLPKVIVLDDFERCSIEIQELFAFINQTIEHYNVKIVLIGNEEEVIRCLQSTNLFNKKPLETCADNKRVNDSLASLPKEKSPYEYIKEKTIYYTAAFIFDLEIFFEDILEEYGDFIKEMVKSSKDKIIQIISSYQCTNFRTLKAAVDSYQKIILRIESSDSSILDSYLKSCILLSSFSYMILYKSGRADSDISSSILSVTDFTPVVTLKPYITKLVWNEETIIGELGLIKANKFTSVGKKVPAVLIELSELWYSKTDEQLTKEMAQLIKEIQSNSLSVRLYFRALSIIATYFYIYGFEQFINMDDIVGSMEKNIASSVEEYDEDDELSCLYIAKEAIPYKIRLKDAFKKRNIGNSKNFITSILLEMDKTSSKKLYDSIAEIHINRCFFSLVDVDALFDKILDASPLEIYYLKLCLSTVYSSSNLRDIFPDDFEKVNELKNKIIEHGPFEKKIKNFAVNQFLEDLKLYCDRLNDYSLDF